MSYFSEGVLYGIGQALRALFLLAVGGAIAVAYTLGVFKLGFQTASAEIYQQQNNDLRALVGIIDQAKARELASCADSGRSDCLATLGEAP
jgi:hypothetical protein